MIGARSLWEMLELFTQETKDPEWPEAVVIKLRAAGRDFSITILGPKETTNFEAINALRAGAQFIADALGVQLGDIKRATADDLLAPPKKEIN